MKLIVGVIKPFKLDAVREALSEIGINGITVSEVKGFGRQKGHTESHRAHEFAEELLPKLKLEVAVRAEMLDAALAVIIKAANSGRIGDGKLFVVNLERVVRVRTSESGPAAI